MMVQNLNQSIIWSLKPTQHWEAKAPEQVPVWHLLFVKWKIFPQNCPGFCTLSRAKSTPATDPKLLPGSASIQNRCGGKLSTAVKPLLSDLLCFISLCFLSFSHMGQLPSPECLSGPCLLRRCHPPLLIFSLSLHQDKQPHLLQVTFKSTTCRSEALKFFKWSVNCGILYSSHCSLMSNKAIKRGERVFRHQGLEVKECVMCSGKKKALGMSGASPSLSKAQQRKKSKEG